MIRSPLSPHWAAPIAGALTGFLALGLFLTAHALVIRPIWHAAGEGLPFVLAAGTAAGCLLAELAWPAAGGWRAFVAAGVRLGAAMLLACVPALVVDVLLRLAGMASAQELVSVVSAISLTALAGAFLGRRARGTRRAAIAGALGAVALQVAMHGPQRVLQSTRAMGITLALVPICLLAGAALGLISWRLSHACARYASPTDAPEERFA